jgi:lipoate-protein ligase B
MIIRDLGIIEYRDAWAMQERLHAEVLGGGEEQLLLLEHPPVITYGRRPGVEVNVTASAELLAQRGVEVVQSDRGGNVTFHGLGQIVAYPIIRLANHKLSVGCYVHRLEDVVIAALAKLGVEGHRDPAAVGVWVGDAKVCAIGVRIRRGVTMHGLALNVETDLSYFDLIVPCGLAGRTVTSLRQILGNDAPTLTAVKSLLAGEMQRAFSATALVDRCLG